MVYLSGSGCKTREKKNETKNYKEQNIEWKYERRLINYLFLLCFDICCQCLIWICVVVVVVCMHQHGRQNTNYTKAMFYVLLLMLVQKVNERIKWREKHCNIHIMARCLLFCSLNTCTCICQYLQGEDKGHTKL